MIRREIVKWTNEKKKNISYCRPLLRLGLQSLGLLLAQEDSLLL
jgi:hypothetical protein